MYTLNDFKMLRMNFRTCLVRSDTADPLICGLYECENAPGAVEFEFDDGSSEIHVAEACNVAAVVNSVDRILSLPRSTVACEDLAEVFLLRLDVLREYVRDLIPSDQYRETANEQLIRCWAGFLKHPRGFVLAHRCVMDWDDIEDALVLDGDAVVAFSKLGSNAKKDAEKDKFRNEPVKVDLPTSEQIISFFHDCKSRMETAIELYK